jgi:glycosyltransferase involved in cell wall biosynthesis
MEKLVSVIMPTHRGADKVSKSVESVLKQSYSNLELIVIDDNGEGTKEQLATYAALQKYTSDLRFKYIAHKVNKRGAVARNTGIKSCRGEYIAFLDDDDVFLPMKIEMQVKKMESISDVVGLIYGSYILYEDNGLEHAYHYGQEGNILYDFLVGKIDICSSTLMIRRKVLDDIKGFDESFLRHQDWEFIARVLHQYQAACLNEVCSHKFAVLRNSSKSAAKIEEFRMHYIEKISYVIDSLPQKQCNEVYDSIYLFIAKSYLKEHNIKKCMQYMGRMSNSIQGYLILAQTVFKKFFMR